MRESDHFYSELVQVARRNRGSPAAAIEEVSLAFSHLVSSVVGADIADELFGWWQQRYAGGESPQWEKLGHMAAFTLGDYDDATMDLDKDDWEAIRDVLSDAADELDLDVLSRLMADLVSHGALD